MSCISPLQLNQESKSLFDNIFFSSFLNNFLIISQSQIDLRHLGHDWFSCGVGNVSIPQIYTGCLYKDLLSMTLFMWISPFGINPK